MISNRVAIVPELGIETPCGSAIQRKFAWDHSVSEVAFADEIWHHADFADRFRIKQEKCVTQTRLLFPKRTFDFRKNSPAANLCGVCKRGRARVRIYGRAVSDDEKRSFIFGRHLRKNVQRPTLNVQHSIR